MERQTAGTGLHSGAGDMVDRSERHGTEALLAGGATAGVLVWCPLLGMLYLLALPAPDPVGLAILGSALITVGLVRAVLRLGLPGARRRC